MESRALLSGFLPSLNTRTSGFVPRDVTDAMHTATTHEIRQVDARLGALMPEARAQHALGKPQGDVHASVIGGQVRSGGAARPAVPLDASNLFQPGSSFTVRFNQFPKGPNYPARPAEITLRPYAQTWTGSTWSLTTTLSTPTSAGQVLNLHFQNTNGMPDGNKLRIAIGEGSPNPTPIEFTPKVTPKVRFARVYVYFTTGENMPVKGIRSALDLTVKTAPQGGFEVFEQKYKMTGNSFSESFTLNDYEAELRALNVLKPKEKPDVVTGIDFGIWVSTPA